MVQLPNFKLLSQFKATAKMVGGVQTQKNHVIVVEMAAMKPCDLQQVVIVVALAHPHHSVDGLPVILQILVVSMAMVTMIEIPHVAVAMTEVGHAAMIIANVVLQPDAAAVHHPEIWIMAE